MTQKGQIKSWGLLIRGMAMGAADVVPGISGGTVAFITGIYEELIDALGACNTQALKLLLKGQIKALWQQINGRFLAWVFGGILISIFSLAKLISWVLQQHPKMLWAYFFGLILASVVMIGREFHLLHGRNLLFLFLGTAFAYLITGLSGVQVEISPLMIFAAGAVAICAMILPGISGSFILVILGVYQPLLSAVTEWRIDLLVCFALGCVIGLLSFTHLLSWLLHHYRALMLALLTGFMLGSLNKVWPWKLSQLQDGKLQETNLWPGDYAALLQVDPQIGAVAVMTLLGLLTVFLIHKSGNANRG